MSIGYAHLFGRTDSDPEALGNESSANSNPGNEFGPLKRTDFVIGDASRDRPGRDHGFDSGCWNYVHPECASERAVDAAALGLPAVSRGLHCR